MTYFGKEFTFERQENFEAYVKVIAEGEEETKEYLEDKTTYKVEKDGDSYKLITGSEGYKEERTFKSGVPFDDNEGGKTTITVNGDTFTQFQDYGSEGSVTCKMEFSPNQFKMTFTCDGWDGVAYRYYKA